MGTLTTGKLVLTNTTSNQDAFDRLRISDPRTLFEIHHVFGKMDRLMNELTSGTGTSTWRSTNSYIEMAVTSSGVGKVVRQSYEYIPYQPGKSRLMLFTGVLETNGGVNNVTSRIGCFDDTADKSTVSAAGNGLFFELTSTGIYVVERLNDTDTKVLQSSWNFDTFDGNGPSELTVTDFSKAIIFGIDQEWLGVGRTRFGFFINGQFHVGHVFNHSGIGSPSSTAVTVPYTRTGKLPVRYEISSSSAVNAEMRMMCSSVISEGGYDPIGDTWASESGRVSISSSWVPLISVRLKETDPYNRGTITLKNLSLVNEGASTNYVKWRVVLLADDTKLTGESFANVSDESVAQIDTTASAVNMTGAYTLLSGFVQTRSDIDFDFGIYLNTPIVNANIAGKSRILSIVGIRTNADTNAFASMSWLELR